MVRMLHSIGRAIARYLEKPVQGYEPFTRAIRRDYENRWSRVTFWSRATVIFRVIKYDTIDLVTPRSMSGRSGPPTLTTASRTS
jgi:hypothetical protein